jgi:hypothetical protein
MATASTLKIGPTLDELRAFYRAVDDALEALVVVRGRTITTDASDVWRTMNSLINGISIDQSDGHPAYGTYLAQKISEKT